MAKDKEGQFKQELPARASHKYVKVMYGYYAGDGGL